eukprot:Sspe_Gene.82465::Locus_54057_Transcript_2_3_Confidence_0.400_Length_1078::g.82465::m.82465
MLLRYCVALISGVLAGVLLAVLRKNGEAVVYRCEHPEIAAFPGPLGELRNRLGAEVHVEVVDEGSDEWRRYGYAMHTDSTGKVTLTEGAIRFCRASPAEVTITVVGGSATLRTANPEETSVVSSLHAASLHCVHPLPPSPSAEVAEGEVRVIAPYTPWELEAGPHGVSFTLTESPPERFSMPCPASLPAAIAELRAAARFALSALPRREWGLEGTRGSFLEEDAEVNGSSELCTLLPQEVLEACAEEVREVRGDVPGRPHPGAVMDFLEHELARVVPEHCVGETISYCFAQQGSPQRAPL